jgi:tetratricopeptide (TPR) repeat protein
VVALEAVALARAAGDARAAAHAHRAHGLAGLELGRLEEATRSFRTAIRAAELGDDPAMAAECRSSLAYALSERGRTADALRQLDLPPPPTPRPTSATSRSGAATCRPLGFLDSAEATYRAQGVRPRELLLTRGELLLSVGAFDEARQTAERAIEQFAAAGWRSLLAEAQLLLSQAQLAGDDVAGALAAATRAATLLGHQHRPGWATMARYTALRAEERAGQLTPRLRRRALREAGRLAARGWRAQELDARLAAARVALEAGDLGTVRREMGRAAAARTRGNTDLRIRAWYAEALLRLADGREAAAEQALQAGFRVMEQQRATLGATELRVHVASHAGDVAELGIQLARQTGSPRKVLDRAERWRAGRGGDRGAGAGRGDPAADGVPARRAAARTVHRGGARGGAGGDRPERPGGAGRRRRLRLLRRRLTRGTSAPQARDEAGWAPPPPTRSADSPRSGWIGGDLNPCRPPPDPRRHTRDRLASRRAVSPQPPPAGPVTVKSTGPAP